MRKLRAICVLLLVAPACNIDPSPGSYSPVRPVLAPPTPLENPTFVPVGDPEAAWMQIVDVVDDYFQIENEVRPRQAGEVLAEGRIDTFARTGSTVFEPWNRDSVNLYERLESTLQSIRRRAFIAVRPAAAGYLVEVIVVEELEDLDQPQQATAGAATFRYDNSINHNNTGGRETGSTADSGGTGDLPRPVSGQTPTIGWIPIGRDTALEQEIIAQLQAQFGQYFAPAPAAGSVIVQPGTVIQQPQQVLPAPY